METLVHAIGSECCRNDFTVSGEHTAAVYKKHKNKTKDVLQGKRIGSRWERRILQICDEYFLYEQVENFNKPHLDTWNEYDDGTDLSNYDFNNDGLAQPWDDANKRKLAYRLCSISNKVCTGAA